LFNVSIYSMLYSV